MEELAVQRRRRPGRMQATLLLALLLLAVVVVCMHIAPTHSSLEVQRPQAQRQRHLQAPASTSGRDGSLFSEAAYAALLDEKGEEVDDEDEDYGTEQQQWGDTGSSQQQQDGTSGDDGVERTLSFDVCRGFANQRIALVSGLVLAKELNRAVVLPRLLFDGRRVWGSDVDFGEVYDLPAFIEALQTEGLRIATETPSSHEVATVPLNNEYDYMTVMYAATEHHLKLECPSFRMPADLIVKHEQLVFAALDALKPVQRLADIISRVEERVLSQASASSFNMLHLNTGDDWPAHCKRWELLTSGLARDNCDNNTDTVGEQLMLHRVTRKLPMVLAIKGSTTEADVVSKALENLVANNYTVIQLQDVFEEVDALKPEEVALVEYYVALRSSQFIGNSVSTSSALLIMQRWHANKFATYYNGGNIPLERFMPLFPLPWVFTYNDWSAGTEYDHMIKGAVTSAITMARMKPFCMFSGSETSVMYQWLVSMNVTIIRHEPKWKEALLKEGRRGRGEYTVLSHLYKTDGAIVGAYLRIDIPMLREFDQYNYVLFTDCDVFFRMHMKLVDWGTPLPTAIGMGFERYDSFPYNDGVMLWNMPYMIKTNQKFVSWLLSQKNGLNYAWFGPLDQGAFNQFYEKEIRGKPISKDFNTMIYHKFRPESRIVHIHGPKPNHYLEYMRTHKCQFRDMCQLGLDGSICKYFAEYKRFVPDWPQVQALVRLCGNLQAGVWHP